MKIGDSIGNNKVIGEGISGGFGVVYPAYDEMLDRPVAIKVLHRHLLEDKVRLNRFLEEARTLARLNHPNIATLYSLMERDGEYFMIMEYVNGPTFHQYIWKKGASPSTVAVPMICQALQGLTHAHAMRVIHRDIKPGNLMINSDGVVKIMDFGIARHLGTERQTKTRGAQGTIEYMSPEQIKAGEMDARSDIYSLGVVLYEMITGRVPFVGTNEFETLRGHLELTPASVLDHAAEIPIGIARCVEVALYKQPSARFENATEFREELEAALAGKRSPARWSYKSPTGQTATSTAAPIASTPAPTGAIAAPPVSKPRPAPPPPVFDLPPPTAVTAADATEPDQEEKKRRPLISSDFLEAASTFVIKLVYLSVFVGLCAAAVMYGPVAWDKLQSSSLFNPTPAHASAAQSSKTQGGDPSAIRESRHTSKRHTGGSHTSSSPTYATTSGTGDDTTSSSVDKTESSKGGDDNSTSADTPSDNSDSTQPGGDTPSKGGDDTKGGSDTKGSDDAKSGAESKPASE